MMRDQDYAVTITASAAALDAFEDALDILPDACLIGSTETGCAALVFSVIAVDPLAAAAAALRMLREVGVDMPNGASLTVLEHEVAA